MIETPLSQTVLGRAVQNESGTGEWEHMIRKLSFSESHGILQSGERVVRRDVREEPEYITGHVTGAELLPVDEITAETAAELIPTYDIPVLVYCRSGMRSARAARLLEKLGYRDIRNMGGLAGWPYGLE